MIFTKYFNPAVGASAADATKVNGDGFNTYYSNKYDDTEKKNLCSAVQNAINHNPAALAQDLGQCKAEIDKCRFNARDALVAQLKDQIEKDKQAKSDLDDDIDDVQTRVTEGCPDCGPSYYQKDPTGFEKTMGIIGAVTPVLGMGLNTWMNLASMKSYYGAYGAYLNQCTTIGVPCGGPGYAGVFPVNAGMGIGSGIMSGMMA